jgi:hypothetical protein|tara:strand:+ start:151 stop:369 length:219 start_codon:yes stop_codon:yes gene_type:complete
MAIKLARLKTQELVYGEAEEITSYCEQNKTEVDFFYSSARPSMVQAHFKYVGNRMTDPYSVAKNPYGDSNGK